MTRLTMAALALATMLTPAVAQEVTVPDGANRRVQADEIDKYLQEKRVFLLDVREPKEMEELGTIEGYTNIPLGELEKRLDELPKDKLILTA